MQKRQKRKSFSYPHLQDIKGLFAFCFSFSCNLTCQARHPWEDVWLMY